MKECTHCGGPNAPENRICDYCGMGFDEDTIPEGSIDPREQAKLDREAWIEANREKDLVELNLDSKDDQHVNVNLPNGQTIRINDPVEKAAALAGTILTGSAASTLKKVSSGGIKLPNIGLEPDDPRFGPGPSRKTPGSHPGPKPGKKSAGCLGCALPVLCVVLPAVLILTVIF